MPRSLRISPRPFVAFGIIFMIPVTIMIGAGFQRGFGPVVEPLLIMAGIYSGIMLAICSSGISVTTEGILTRKFFLKRSFIPFKAMIRTEVGVVAEWNHPAFITFVHEVCNVERRVKMSLKPYRPEDVNWLCKLPELRVRTSSVFS